MARDVHDMKSYGIESQNMARSTHQEVAVEAPPSASDGGRACLTQSSSNSSTRSVSVSWSMSQSYTAIRRRHLHCIRTSSTPHPENVRPLDSMQ